MVTSSPDPAADPLGEAAAPAARTFEIRTYGCQMNQHDSERIAGTLMRSGYRPVDEGEDADLVVFNTCAVRENADNRLYGNLGHQAPDKRARPGTQIAVTGCASQMDRDTVVRRAPWVDAVVGTHNLGSLPQLLEKARATGEPQVEILDTLRDFPSDLPALRKPTGSAWVSISVGCNNTCTYCIVPTLRGPERDRSPEEILAEVRALADRGVLEVTLLGQNVNTYGVGFGRQGAFADLLRACGQIEGIERIRFASPHPAAFTDDVVKAMAETPTVMPHLHMPLQSGSDRVLRAMRRSYRSERFAQILDRVRDAIGQIAISTDVIVGFPGETDDDFEDTLKVVEASRFSQAFTFQYSRRPGTVAADLPGAVPPDVVAQRYARLVELQEQISWEENRLQEGKDLEVLVTVGQGRKDGATHRLSGRAPDNRLVHFAVPEGASPPRPGDMATVRVTYGAPHHLVADGALIGGPFAVRRTRAGDAWRAAVESDTAEHL